MLPQPQGIVYSEDSTTSSSNNSDSSLQENADVARHLSEELAEDRGENSSVLSNNGGAGGGKLSEDENPIKQVTDTVREANNGQNYVFALLTGYRYPPAGISRELLQTLHSMVKIPEPFRTLHSMAKIPEP